MNWPLISSYKQNWLLYYNMKDMSVEIILIIEIGRIKESLTEIKLSLCCYLVLLNCYGLFFWWTTLWLLLQGQKTSFFLTANQKITKPIIPTPRIVPITIPAIAPPETLSSYTAVRVVSPFMVKASVSYTHLTLPTNSRV